MEHTSFHDFVNIPYCIVCFINMEYFNYSQTVVWLSKGFLMGFISDDKDWESTFQANKNLLTKILKDGWVHLDLV